VKVGVTQASDALSSASPRELCKCGLEIDVLVLRNIQRLTAKIPRAWYKRRGIPCGHPGFGSAIGASHAGDLVPDTRLLGHQRWPNRQRRARMREWELLRCE
jgi:hypothetical protein